MARKPPPNQFPERLFVRVRKGTLERVAAASHVCGTSVPNWLRVVIEASAENHLTMVERAQQRAAALKSVMEMAPEERAGLAKVLLELSAPSVTEKLQRDPA